MERMNEIKDYFPGFEKLDEKSRRMLEASVSTREYRKDEIVSSGGACLGLIIVKSGQLKAYITSDEGRKITVARFFEYDFCLYSATCALRDLQFDVSIQAENDTVVFIIPADVYKALLSSSLVVSNYTSSVLSSRLTDMMWLLDNVLFKSMDKRLASYLVEVSRINGSLVLDSTHEKIASDLGSAREVITRMLRYFQSEHLVEITRGEIRITDIARLEKLAGL
jgi:cAMP-binding proteins - catabolite gene activator and regulatory subunit of cAMP-dependent protein kinases